MKPLKRIYICISLILLILTLCACESSESEPEVVPDTVLEEPVSNENSEDNQTGQTEESPQDESETNSGDFAAFTEWMEAESAVSERFMYERVIEGFLIADDEIAHGWIDEGTKAFLRVIKGNALALEATTNEYINAYKNLDKNIGSSGYCIRDFFTVDEYNNATNSGIYNFLRTIDQLEDELFEGKDLVTITEDNSVSWDFDDTQVANALGISKELITILMHAAVDAGFSITFD